MDPIVYIDRKSGKQEIEKVYGGAALEFLYGNSLLTRFIGRPLLPLLAKNAFISHLYGIWQDLPLTKKKIRPFIEYFGVDSSEFMEPATSFRSFNDFFIRKLKLSARPIAKGEDIAIIPADGRYRFYPNISQADGFLVKGKKFDLSTLLQDDDLASKYAQGTMVIARLCPSDYHRYHFPCSCIARKTHLINGSLYSVNPIALKQNIHIFSQNKRTLCELENDRFGKILYLEIGATNVGSIHQTYTPGEFQEKGAEKGFFSFGGSSLILLFEPSAIVLDDDLLQASEMGIEIRCLMGERMGQDLRKKKHLLCREF
jgi:phosphatidylserine decarboxylase